jgi:hypothetical protein
MTGTALWLGYAALASGLMGLGGLLLWLSVRRPRRPASAPLRAALVMAALVAVAGVVTVAILEARVQP